MQAVLFSIVVLCVLNSATAWLDKKKTTDIFNKCKQTTRATEDVADIVDKLKFPTSPAGKCMMHCSLEAYGMMNGDKINLVAISEYFMKYFTSNRTELEKVAKAVASCSVRLGEMKKPDKCDIAAFIYQCAKENNIQLA